MKRIDLRGQTWLEHLPGSGGWYWSMDCTSGDLYEAEELYDLGKKIPCNRLLLAKSPEGRVVEPLPARAGQYFGRPLWHEGEIFILTADFPAGKLCIRAFDPETEQLRDVAELGREQVKDCYNLQLHASPLTLTRQGGENRFQIVWPEQADFAIDGRESFDFREGDLLYFARWYEDPDYREEVVVRRLDGEIVETYPGAIFPLPDGSRWHLV